MRIRVGRAFVGAFATLFLLSAMPAVAQDLVPPKRLVLSENTDMPGGDIASIFDTTLEACQRACLTNNQCKAFTFNTRNGSCFPKSKLGEPTAFDGAYSGSVLEAEKGAEDRAKTRRTEEQHVVHRLAPHFRAFDEHAQIILRRRLPDEYGQRLGPQGRVSVLDLAMGGKEGVIGHGCNRSGFQMCRDVLRRSA